MTTRTVRVKVSRFDPSKDKSSHYQTYDVPWYPKMTIMDALDYIYENLDPSLAYHSHTACHRRACARCNLTVNSKPSLSCHTEVNGDITIEPLPRLKVIRDLVVAEL